MAVSIRTVTSGAILSVVLIRSDFTKAMDNFPGLIQVPQR